MKRFGYAMLALVMLCAMVNVGWGQSFLGKDGG